MATHLLACMWLYPVCIQVSSLIINGSRPPIPAPDELPGGEFEELDDYVTLMQRCWAQDPVDRPTFAEIVAIFRQARAGLWGQLVHHM